jgi:hypothetical protein
MTFVVLGSYDYRARETRTTTGEDSGWRSDSGIRAEEDDTMILAPKSLHEKREHRRRLASMDQDGPQVRTMWGK